MRQETACTRPLSIAIRCPARRSSRPAERRRSKDALSERRDSKDSIMSEALSDAAPVKSRRAKKADDDLDEVRPAEIVV